MRTNYVLIDHENVQPSILPALKQLGCKVMVFVGANQTRVLFEMVASLQELGGQASYVKISGNGPNALDLHIAFYIGELSQREPDAFFHIISKDTGFDPLVEHLKSRGIFAKRSASFAEVALLKAASASTLAERRELIVGKLVGLKAAKPGKVKTLTNTIHALFCKQISEAEAGALVKSLEKENLIRIEDTRVVYLPPSF